MTVEVDLLRDFAEQIQVKFDIDTAIDQLDIVRFYAWYELRRLPQRKWIVHYSIELQNNPFFIEKNKYIEQIRNKAETGQDLTPHASIQIDKIQGRDELLADWGIYHLHPGHGTKVTKSGFVNRGSELLFVFPHGNTLYFLDVLGHSWTNFSLIEVIDKNWPAVIDHCRYNDAIKLDYEPTETELYEMRKNQINASFRVGNSFFMGPGGGVAANGAAVRSVIMSMNAKKILDNYSKQLKCEESNLRKKYKEATGNSLGARSICLKLSKYNAKTATCEIEIKNSNDKFLFSLSPQ